MSFVTFADLLKGAERSTREAKVLQQLDLLIRHVSGVLSERFGDLPPLREAIQTTEGRGPGTLIGDKDLWIAAHALALEAVLVTSNVRAYERVCACRSRIGRHSMCKRWRTIYRRHSVSVELAPYDPADLLRTDEDIRAYLTDALNDDNPSVFVIALGDVVRIRGIENVARQSGLDLQRLQAVLSTHGNPQWEKIHRILKSLDIHLQAAA